MKRLEKLNGAILLALCVLLMPQGTFSQMTIGGDIAPVAGAVLDLSPSGGHVGGLKLPNVALESLEYIPASLTAINSAQNTNVTLRGLVVYNTTTNTTEGLSPGMHEWDGTKWLSTRAIGAQKSAGGWSGSASWEVVPSLASELLRGALHDDCPTTAGYIATVVSGGGFATVKLAGAPVGHFYVVFTSNVGTTPRSAIVKLVAPCGNETIFIYVQSPASAVSQPNQIGSVGGYIEADSYSRSSGSASQRETSVSCSAEWLWVTRANGAKTGMTCPSGSACWHLRINATNNDTGQPRVGRCWWTWGETIGSMMVGQTP